MIKVFKFFLLLLIALAGVMMFPFSQSLAAETVEDPGAGISGQSWTCLNVRAVNKKTHTVEVYSNPDSTFSSQMAAYIVECYSLPSGLNTCSTGDLEAVKGAESADSKLGLNGPPPGWKILTYPNQPVEITPEGKLKVDPVTWQSKGTPTATVHSFFLVQEILQVTQVGESSGNAPSLQLGTWSPNITNYNSSSNCVTLNWDPTGITFDSRSLEPIDNVRVTLYNEAGTIFSDPTVTNPDISEENGRYTFYIPSGNYSMKAEKTSFTFPSTTDPLPFQSDPAFPYINIYRGGNYSEPEGELVVENIPMDPSGTPYRRDAAIISWSYQLLNTENTYKFSGSALHPKSGIKIISSGQTVGEGTADEFGLFEIFVDALKINNAGEIIIQAEKPAIMQQTVASFFPFRFLSNLIEKSFAAQTPTSPASYKVEPILNFIEGYALDLKTSAPIPKATVTVYTEVSTKPFYQTTADDTGYFKIPSQFLPTFPYYLEIQNPKIKQSFAVTTSQFVAQNEKYPLKKKNVDYGKYQPEPTMETSSPSASKPGETGLEGEGNLPPAGKTEATKQSWGLVLTLVFVTTGLAGGGIFLMVKKRKENQPSLSDQASETPNPPIKT